MDKFLAKKNPVFKQDQTDKDSYGLGVNLTEQAVRYKLNGTILQLVLKSMYENARKYVYTVHAYQQLQADIYFLFHVCFGRNGEEWFDILPSLIDDSTPIYSGLFNEVISSCLTRYLPEASEEESKTEEATSGGKTALPQGLDETLLQTMIQVKRDQLMGEEEQKT